MVKTQNIITVKIIKKVQKVNCSVKLFFMMA